MYYSVLIETNEKDGKFNKDKQYFEFDKTDLSLIKTRIVEPYLREDSFRFDGFEMGKKELTRIKIKQTEQTMQALAQYETRCIPANVFMSSYTPKNIFFMKKYAIDITDAVIDEVEASIS